MVELDIDQRQRDLIQTTIGMAPDAAGAVLDLDIRPRILARGQKAIDAPCHSVEEDAFGFTRIAIPRCHQLCSPTLETPFTLVIDGDWGVGKSSLARLIYLKLLENDMAVAVGCLPVWIDTSIIDGENEVFPIVAEEIRQAACLIAKRISTDPTKQGKFEAAIDFLAPVGHGAGANDSQRRNVERRLREDAGEWLNTWAASEAADWTFARFHRLVKSIRHSLLGRGGTARLVLFIDDLDRCHQPVVLRMLDLHRTLLETWGVILIYPMNVRVIEAIVQKRFLEEGTVAVPYRQDYLASTSLRQAETFLEKLFFRRIRPPEPGERDLDLWLRGLLPDVTWFPGLFEFLRDAFYANPRYIKRFAVQVRELIQAFENSTNDGTWDGLLALNDPSIACKLVAKVAAFAMADPFRHFYEPVRKPDPALLLTSELSAFDGSPLPFMVYDADQRIWQETVSPAPKILTDFLKCGPRLSANFEATRSAFLAVETVLPVSPFRWRAGTQLEGVASEKATRTQETLPVSASDRETIQELIESWIATLGSTSPLPPRIAELVKSAISDPVVHVFRIANWAPSAQALVQGAILAVAEKRQRDVMWLLAAASVREDWKLEQLRTTLQLLGDTHVVEALILDYADWGQVRLGENDEVILNISQGLLDCEGQQAAQRALSGFLRVLHLTPQALESASFEIDDRLGETLYSSAFLGALDALGQLKRHDKELQLAECAIRIPSGVQKSAVVRNLGRAIESCGIDMEAARRVYDAAICLSENDDRASSWGVMLRAEPDERLLYLLASMDRDPRDPSYPGSAGIAMHNSGRRRDARRWLEYAVYLNPHRQDSRRALIQNLLQTAGPREAENAADLNYVPKIEKAEEMEMLKEADQAHMQLIRKILSQGPIEYKGVVLLDPKNPPKWIGQRFPELS